MILYEFYCNNCDKTFEMFTKVGVRNVKCPVCNNNSQKVFSCPNYITGDIPEAAKDNPNKLSSNYVTRIPEYRDKITGKTFLGKPEIKKI